MSTAHVNVPYDSKYMNNKHIKVNFITVSDIAGIQAPEFHICLGKYFEGVPYVKILFFD